MSSSTHIQHFRVQQQSQIFNVESYYHKDTDKHLVELDDMEVILGQSNRFATEPRISAVFLYGQTVDVALDQRRVPMFPLSIVVRPDEILEVTLEAFSPVIEQSEQFPSPPVTPPPLANSDPQASAMHIMERGLPHSRTLSAKNSNRAPSISNSIFNKVPSTPANISNKAPSTSISIFSMQTKKPSSISSKETKKSSSALGSSNSKLIRDISEDLVGKADFVINYLKDIGEHDITTSSNRPRDHVIGQDFLNSILESDLFELRDAIAASSIRHLELDGERYNDSWDPVLTIMAIPKLQVFSVKKFRGFLQNATWRPKDVQIRSLDFSDQPITDATVRKVIVACPFLTTLTLSTTDIKSTFDNIRRTAEQHGNLVTLTLKQSDPSRPSNADKPSVTYYFDKRQRTILSATLLLRTQFYGDLIQLPMIKKVAYRPIASGDQRVYDKAKQTALMLVKRFTEMETFVYQCHFDHFRDLFTAIKQQQLAIKEQPYQISVLRRVKLVDEHGSFLTSQDIQGHAVTRCNYEEASRLVQGGIPDPGNGRLQRDQYGTSRGSVGAQRPQESLQRAQIGGSVNRGRAVSTSAYIPYALPIYTTIDPRPPLSVPAVRRQGPVSPRLTPSSSEDDGSRMKTMVFDSSLTYPRIREIHNSISARGHSALEKMVWDITDLNNVRILEEILAILSDAQTSNQSRKLDTEIRIRLVSGMCNPVGGGGGGGGMGEGSINSISQPGLSRLLSSDDRTLLWILFTMHVTRLELFGRDLDTFLPRLCKSYDWTMSGLRELVVDGKSNNLNKTSLEYLQDIVSRGPDSSAPGRKTLRPAQPLQQLIIQNMRLFDAQWSQLITSLDWLTLRQISFRGSDFKYEQLVELGTEVIQLVERCREKQRVLSMNSLSSKDAAMINDLMWGGTFVGVVVSDACDDGTDPGDAGEAVQARDPLVPFHVE
ncbi:hypothetical protein K457DRAFT_156602 [Linnemannia elongata AG-77]|uniref:Uncharacterized protein n=1 Tax=Linnemannia elongata AG-77 TaxID=1314771 RepID=A0A197JR03_9FUNG|nr:hypothetical protein K457DRAFT_156602 [Linnemannia elongata AG-77]